MDSEKLKNHELRQELELVANQLVYAQKDLTEVSRQFDEERYFKLTLE